MQDQETAEEENRQRKGGGDFVYEPERVIGLHGQRVILNRFGCQAPITLGPIAECPLAIFPDLCQ